MFPSSFEYVVPSTVPEAVALLEEHGDDAKIIAGGHSLLPMMKLRLASPAVLVDIGRIPGLSGVTVNGKVSIGALTTYAAMQDSPELAQHLPLLAEVASEVGDMQVRNRGTIGGSVAHADPAADMPAALLALDAEIHAAGASGERTIPIGDFFQGLFSTALEQNEVVTAISVAPLAAGTGTAYLKFKNPASGYAVVGVAVVITRAADGTAADVRIGITGAGAQAVRATAVEDALKGQALTAEAIKAAATHAADGIEFLADIHASEEYRAHLTRVLTTRALTLATERASV